MNIRMFVTKSRKMFYVFIDTGNKVLRIAKINMYLRECSGLV